MVTTTRTLCSTDDEKHTKLVVDSKPLIGMPLCQKTVRDLDLRPFDLQM